MKFAILSLAAAAGLAFSADSAFAGPPGHYHGGYNSGYGGYNRGGHLDYHNGHYHYHNGAYRSGPLYPVYPSYSYPSYGYNYGVARPGVSITIGSGGLYPAYGGYNRPYGNIYGPRW